MEIKDAHQIEIFHTLSKIERLNKAIAFHKATENPDQLAIEQYYQVKNDLTQNLLKLFADMDLKLQIAA